MRKAVKGFLYDTRDDAKVGERYGIRRGKVELLVRSNTWPASFVHGHIVSLFHGHVNVALENRGRAIKAERGLAPNRTCFDDAYSLIPIAVQLELCHDVGRHAKDSGYQNSDTGRAIADKTTVLAQVRFTRGGHVRRESRSGFICIRGRHSEIIATMYAMINS